MDTNPTAVAKALRHSNLLLHGHTHRPAIHAIDDKYRMVLGDWRICGGQAVAVIGVWTDALGLYEFTYKN